MEANLKKPSKKIATLLKFQVSELALHMFYKDRKIELDNDKVTSFISNISNI